MVLERCSKEHNLLAVLRTAEAFGIQDVWLVGEGSATPKPHRLNRGAEFWLTVRAFPDTASCLTALRAEGRTLWVADTGPEAEALATPDSIGAVPARLALALGREADGASEAMLAAADRRIYLPLHGFTESLNVSVAAALLLQRILDACPEARGDLSPERREALRREWYRRLAGSKRPDRFDAWLEAPPGPLEDLRQPPELRRPRVRKRAARSLGMKNLGPSSEPGDDSEGAPPQADH